MTTIPIISMSCIDFIYDDYTSDYLKTKGISNFDVTTAGGPLCLSFPKCTTICKDSCNCDPYNSDMLMLREAACKNIEVATSIQKIRKIKLICHQDCKAIMGYLGDEKYPKKLGDDNSSEIKIHEKILTSAKQYIDDRYKNKFKVDLEVIDVNGSVAKFTPNTKRWKKVHTGPGKNSKGLWYE
jgi:hypothetical protein